MGLGALTTVLLSYLNNHTAVPVTALMSGTACAGLLTLIAGNKKNSIKLSI